METLHLDLGNGYSVRPMTWEAYLAACERLESRIFGDYFGFQWLRSRDGEQQKSFERLTMFQDALLKVVLGVFYGDQLVGWHYSVQRSNGEILMGDTGILPEHQNRGTYSRLLPELLKHFQSLGFERVVSYHRTTNNQVIVPKLRAGFIINGLTVDEYGLAVELVYAYNAAYRDSLRVRSGEIKPTGRVADLMGL